MNTRNDTPTRIRISPEEAQPQVARQPQRRMPNPLVMRSLQLGMLASGAVIVVLALMMLLLPMIKINKIVVEGNSYYDDATVAQMAGIAEGDELFGWNMQDACNALIKAYPYASDVYISIQFFTVKIEVVEKPTVMYAEYQGQYFSIDRDLRVLEIKADGEEAFSPFLRVKLPTLEVVQVGQKLQFVNDEMDLSYMTTLLNILGENHLLEDVTYVDFSERFSLSFVLSNSVRVEIGELQEMEKKLKLLGEELQQKPINHNIYEVVDVSNTSKAIRREIGAEKLFE